MLLKNANSTLSECEVYYYRKIQFFFITRLQEKLKYYQSTINTTYVDPP